MKFCALDNVGKITKLAKNCRNQLARGGSPDMWNIRPYHFSQHTYNFLRSRTSLCKDQTAWRLKWRIICLADAFWGSRFDHTSFRDPKPSTPNSGAHFSPKSITSNKFLTARERRKTFNGASAQNLNQGVERGRHFQRSLYSIRYRHSAVLRTAEKVHIFQRCKMDMKYVLNSNGKSCLRCRTMTLLLV